MNLLVFAILVVLVCGLLVWAVRSIPAIPAPYNMILQVLILVVGALTIAEHAGLFAA